MADSREGALARLAVRQHGAFTRSQAFELGWSESTFHRLVEGGRWVQLHSGVYGLAGDPPTPERAAHAGVLAAGDDAVLSHRSAAAVWLGRPWPRTVQVTTAHPQSPTLEGVRIWRCRTMEPGSATVRKGFPVTALARTLVTCAIVARPKELQLLVDEAVRLGLAQPAELVRDVMGLRRRGRRGPVAVLELLGGIPEDVAACDSLLEAILMRLAGEEGLPPPVHHHRVGRYELDFAWPDVKVAAETDGALVHGRFSQREKDILRDRELSALGWLVLRFGWRDLSERAESSTAQIREVLRRRRSLLSGRASSHM